MPAARRGCACSGPAFLERRAYQLRRDFAPRPAAPVERLNARGAPPCGLAVTPAGRVLLAWVDRAADGAGDILVAASDDGGRGFHPPVRVNDDEGAGRGQEYQNMQITPSGLVVLVWLDERLGAVLAWEDDGRTLAHARLMAREEGIPMGRHEHDFSKDP